LSKRGRDTESDANIQLEEMLTFFSNEFPLAFPHEIPKCVFNNITYQSKERYAYCGSPIKTLLCTCEVGFGRIKDMKMMLDKKKIVRIN